MKGAHFGSNCKISTQGTMQSMQRQIQQCMICLEVVDQRLFYSVGCNHYFCQFCLIQYVDSKIKDWSYIQCCQQGCQHVIDQSQSSIYHILPNNTKKKIDSLLDNYDRMINIRHCKKCQLGVLIEKINSQKKRILQCKQCEQLSCYNCFGILHSGKCTNLQILDYPPNCGQCRKCRSIVQKKQGCSHIKCLCGYQFCFQCSYHWNSSHICQFKIHKRTGFSLHVCNFIKIAILIPMSLFILAISLAYILIVCFLSGFMLGFTGWIDIFQYRFIKNRIKNEEANNQSSKTIEEQQTNSQKIFFLFCIFVWLIIFPLSIVVFSFVGFFVPFYNLCDERRIVLEPNILLEYVEQIRHCYDVYWIL